MQEALPLQARRPQPAVDVALSETRDLGFKRFRSFAEHMSAPRAGMANDVRDDPLRHAGLVTPADPEDHWNTSTRMDRVRTRVELHIGSVGDVGVCASLPSAFDFPCRLRRDRIAEMARRWARSPLHELLLDWREALDMADEPIPADVLDDGPIADSIDRASGLLDVV